MLVEAVSWITPLQAGESPSICRSQSVTTSSISVTAGLDCHESPITPSPVLTMSARIPAGKRVGGEIAEEARMLPKRKARNDDAD